MLDLQWNFPLLPEQEGIWRDYLNRAMREYSAETVEIQRPSFRTVEQILRETAARLLKFPVARTWVTAGGHHGTLNALLASGLVCKRIAVEANTYPGFLDQCRATKTSFVACTTDQEGIVPDALRSLCERLQKTGVPLRGLFTMPTVQNPTGYVTPLERREQIVEIARGFELTIIEDDAYGFMQPNAPASYAVLAPERTYYVRGLSKSFSPATRTGFLIAPESANDALATSLRCTATGTDVPQNLASLLMMEDGTLDHIIDLKRTEGAARNWAARELLGEAAAPGAPCAWHLWVKLKEGHDSRAVEDELRSKGVLVSAGHWCAAGPEYGKGIRLALGGEIKRERTLEGVRIVADVLSSSEE